MQTLHVRSVPDGLYDRLRAMANAKKRSISAQVLFLLDRAVEEEEHQQEQAQILADIRTRRFTPPPTAPDSVEVLREDRAR